MKQQIIRAVKRRESLQLGKKTISFSHRSLCRLYQKGIFTGFRRSQRLQHSGQALVHITGCVDRTSSKFYHGKRVAYIWKGKNSTTGKNYKCRWGKVIASHGNGGGVRVKFQKNLPPRAMGASVRVMLYPNKVV